MCQLFVSFLYCNSTVLFILFHLSQLLTVYTFKHTKELLLWSEIKLTSYEFSDLQITGEFDNRPGTGRFKKKFSCVVTYRTGAAGVCIRTQRLMLGRAPYDIVSYVRHCTVPGRRCKRFTRMIQTFTCNDVHVYTLIPKFPIIPPKKRVIKIRNTETDSDRDGGETHTCSRLQKKSIALVRYM